MYRGAVALSAILGATAVTCALSSVLWETLSTAAKTVEVVLLGIVILLYRRGTHYAWKQRWLNYRRLERHLNAAAWLALLGRTIHIHIPAHVSTFHERAAWENWYTRAILRDTSLPRVRIDREYLNTVRD